MTDYDHRREIKELGSWIDAGRDEEIQSAYRWLQTKLNPDDWDDRLRLGHPHAALCDRRLALAKAQSGFGARRLT